MRRTVRDMMQIVSVLAVLDTIGCEDSVPTEPYREYRWLSIVALGDVPVQLEYLYEIDPRNTYGQPRGRNEGKIRIDTSWTGQGSFYKAATVLAGSSFRVCACSEATNGYAYAQVRVSTGSSWTGDYKEWFYKEAENWGGAVEIKGYVP
jgi:hypothetical protein